MEHERQHYVNGEWVAPLQPTLVDVVDPSTEEAFTQIAVGGPRDVDRAVAAAKAAFPSYSRLNAIIWSEVMHAAGVPAGVYNMVQGEGAVVGGAMSAHPDIDMMSFTGSTRAGILVAQAAATTVKRVSQELGGKSANILLPDVDFKLAVTKGVLGMMGNSGQSCNAPTRMFVPADRHEEVKAIAKAAAETVVVGSTNSPR